MLLLVGGRSDWPRPLSVSVTLRLSCYYCKQPACSPPTLRAESSTSSSPLFGAVRTPRRQKPGARAPNSASNTKVALPSPRWVVTKVSPKKRVGWICRVCLGAGRMCCPVWAPIYTKSKHLWIKRHENIDARDSLAINGFNAEGRLQTCHMETCTIIIVICVKSPHESGWKIITKNFLPLHRTAEFARWLTPKSPDDSGECFRGTYLAAWMRSEVISPARIFLAGSRAAGDTPRRAAPCVDASIRAAGSFNSAPPFSDKVQFQQSFKEVVSFVPVFLVASMLRKGGGAERWQHRATKRGRERERRRRKKKTNNNIWAHSNHVKISSAHWSPPIQTARSGELSSVRLFRTPSILSKWKRPHGPDAIGAPVRTRARMEQRHQRRGFLSRCPPARLPACLPAWTHACGILRAENFLQHRRTSVQRTPGKFDFNPCPANLKSSRRRIK